MISLRSSLPALLSQNGGMYGLEWSSGDRYRAGDHHARLLGSAAFDGLFGAAFFGAVKLKTTWNRSTRFLKREKRPGSYRRQAQHRENRKSLSES
jgi:hypothetical protein